MLVCGLTYDHTINYGSLFQAFALQSAIESIDISGEKCEYQLIPIRKFTDWPDNCRSARKKRHINIISSIIRFGIYFHRLQFKEFEKQKVHFADVTNMKSLPSLNQKADAFVCGSDVIWNSHFNFYLPAFFLDFANKYKFSYAASFGKATINNREIAQIQSFLPLFNDLSCRERTGQDIIEKYTGRKAMVVADPVLLLDSFFWNSIAGEKHKSRKFIFIYITHNNPVIKKFLNILVHQTKLKVIYASYGPKQAIQSGKIQIQKPDKWLRLIRDAEYVVTNSFHATVFCTLFHKKFFTVVQGGKDKGINVRMNDFLQMIGLEDRLFSSVPEILDLDEIDYRTADREIMKMREESMIFLRKNLEAAYQQRSTVLEVTMTDPRI